MASGYSCKPALIPYGYLFSTQPLLLGTLDTRDRRSGAFKHFLVSSHTSVLLWRSTYFSTYTTYTILFC